MTISPDGKPVLILFTFILKRQTLVRIDCVRIIGVIVVRLSARAFASAHFIILFIDPFDMTHTHTHSH